MIERWRQQHSTTPSDLTAPWDIVQQHRRQFSPSSGAKSVPEDKTMKL